MTLHFIVPGPPSAWQRAASFIQRGRLVTANPKGMKEAQEKIAWAAKAALRGGAPMTGALRLELLCVYEPPASWPKWKREAARIGSPVMWKTSPPDHDNLTKQVGDALNGVAYGDDAQICRSSVAKRYGYPARTEVRLSHLEGFSESIDQAAFRDWASGHGTAAQMKAAGEWLKRRRSQPTLPLE